METAISSTLIPLLSKTKKEIKLKELASHPIQVWGDAAEDYEKQYNQPWDRNEIDRATCRIINFRWKLPVYRPFLPEGMRDKTPEDDSWKDPSLVSIVELARFLKKTCEVSQGKANLKEGYAELLQFIQSHSLPMKRRTLSKGIEDFITRIDEMRDDNPDGFIFTGTEERELSKAVHAMVASSRRYDEVLDTAVGNAVHEMMKDDTKTSFNKTLTLLNNGLSYAIDRVIGSSIFDNCEKGSYRGKTRFSSSPSHAHRASESPESKKKRDKSPSTGLNKDTAVCNGCGRFITDFHTQDNCEHIKNKTVGFNEDWARTPWADSKACKALKEKILTKKPEFTGPVYLPPPRSSRLKDTDTKGMISCSTLSTTYSHSLPIIQATLMAKPGIATLEVEVEEEEEAMAATEGALITRPPAELKMDNIEGSQGLSDKLTTIFIDTGAGDNFVSAQYAESLINYGYNPIKTNTICKVCSAFNGTCEPCGQTYSLSFLIKDGTGEDINLKVVAKTLPIKYDIIIGLKDIRDNNLMWRFPEIFLSKDFTGYLENNLLWSYLRAMFKEHLSRVDQDRWRASIEGDKRLDRTAESWDSLRYATVELAVSDASSRKHTRRIEPSPDPGQSPEQGSTHPLPHYDPQGGTPKEYEEDQRPLTGPVRKKKRKSSKKEKGRQAQSAKQGHSERKARNGNGSLQSNRLRWESRRRIGVKLRKVQIRHLHEIATADAPPKTNFSAISPFEAEGLQDLRDNDLEAIPTDMLRAIDEGSPTELPDLQHIKDSQSEKLFRDLCNEYPELFRATVNSIEARVRPFSLKVDQQGWETRGNRAPPRRLDSTREAELRRQIDLLLRLGVIRESRAGFYSHAFVVPKPGKKWRLVLDFKPLNKVSEAESG